ncbi:MAG: hypothetical protein FJW39_31355 [Acidobacteria bacterium]|nr:hypothetical protein [Acidobacteriota bacterium]
MRVALLAAAGSALLFAQGDKYTGPTPPKPDVPYLLHATNLVEMETGEAKEEPRKDAVANVVAGAASNAKTPLAEPIFLIASEKLEPQKLELYKMDVKGGKREVVVPTGTKRAKNAPRPLRMKWDKLGPGLFRVEVNQYLENGEYCISPQGSMQVFCFQVY